MSVPTITDTVTEPEEPPRAQTHILDNNEWLEGPILTGKVTDAPRR